MSSFQSPSPSRSPSSPSSPKSFSLSSVSSFLSSLSSSELVSISTVLIGIGGIIGFLIGKRGNQRNHKKVIPSDPSPNHDSSSLLPLYPPSPLPSPPFPSHFLHVPLCRQGTGFTAAISCLQSILYLFGEEWREETLSQNCEADLQSGVHVENIQKFCEKIDFQCEVLREMSVSELKSHIDRGQPIILSLQAWGTAESENDNETETDSDITREIAIPSPSSSISSFPSAPSTPKKFSDTNSKEFPMYDASPPASPSPSSSSFSYVSDYSNGHYVICVGYDDVNVYLMDPSTLGNFCFLSFGELEERWHDLDGKTGERVQRMGVKIWKQRGKEALYDPTKILKMG